MKKTPWAILFSLLLCCSGNAGELTFRYGYAPDRVGFSEAGWMADSEHGHATDHEDQYDYSRITVGLKNNFIRSYLWKVNDYPGVRTPGKITFRLRRLGNSSKIILQVDGKSICTYLNKDPDNDRYLITGGTNKKPIYWGSKKALKEWHDYTLEYDGKVRSFVIDNDPATRIELKLGKTKHPDHLSLGMGYEYGKDMYIDVKSLCFIPPGVKPETLPTSPRREGGFTVKYKNGGKRIECAFFKGLLQGTMKRWHPNGRISSKGAYESGLRNGEWNWWYPNGGERLTVNYRKGELHGQFLKFYPDGQTETSVRYQNDLADGLFVRWFPKGAPKLTGGYKANLMDGYWAQWAPSGKCDWAHMAAAGKKDVFLKIWYKDGSPKLIKFFDKTIPHGLYVEYHANGRERIRGTYERGEKSGKWFSWDNNGKVISEEMFQPRINAK